MSQSEDSRENRKHARFELLEYAILQPQGAGRTVRSVVIDVSLGGLQVRSKETFEPGTTMTIQICRATGEPLVVSGEVRYCLPIEESDLYATGFRCHPKDTGQRMEWVDYVHGVFQSQGEHLVS
ncbi:MAG: PilZ domain-containing protein [Armatimonadetes bacterium]|nr:PilZ domain-containing protein [Armatimonadota bacterium]